MVIKSEDQSPFFVINTLGHFEILQDGQRVEEIKLRKAQALFVYLLLHPGQHDRSRLAGLLWGDCSEVRARHNLRQTLWRLRRGLPAGLLNEERYTVGLKQEGRISVDVLTFEAELQQAETYSHRGDISAAIPHLQNAVTLYQGKFLADLDMEESPEFAAWSIGYAAHLREMALAAFSRLTAYLLRRGNYEQALLYARQQLQLEPWWEEGHRLMMILLALTGRRGAALAQYELCRSQLIEEVGVEPMPETIALYRRLLNWNAADWAVPATAVATLRLPFSGRGQEHARLVAWWEQARGGTSRLSLIKGEAGVGKTRLVEETIRYAEMQGALALRGRCYEFGGDIPYQPIAEAFRSVLSRGAEEQGSQGDSARLSILAPVWLAELSRLLPELRQLWPDLPQPQPVAGLAARQRLFEAVARFLRALTRPTETLPPTPLILFLDDLHWADASTLDLLHYLLRNLAGAPVWIVGAYRPEETGPSHLLTRLRQGLSRDHLVNHLRLAPLSADAVTEIAGSLVGAGAAQTLAAFLYRESEGNPFYLIETVYSLQEQGALSGRPGGRRWLEPATIDQVPRSVQDVILQRVGRLNPPARRLLTLAAVIGQHFDSALLRAAARQDARHVSESLEEWLTRHLVQPQPASPGQYDFSHDKIRAVVYEAAEAGQRQTLHRRVGEALEQPGGVSEEERAGLLAYHWSQAGDPSKAIPYLLQAGDQARLLYARSEAVTYYRQALLYLQDQGKQEQAARTLMKLGLTYHNAFDFAQARQAYDEAFALWQQPRTQPSPLSRAAASRPLRLRWLEPVSLDPALALDHHTDCLIAHLFSGLVELSPTMNVVPDVARSWEVAKGGRVFIFHLRNDVQWSDDTAVTAHDFAYAWKRTLSPTIGSQSASFLYDLKGARSFHQGAGRAKDVGVRALDDFTLQVELAHPVGYFPQLLTHVSWYPVPRHIVEQQGATWAERKSIVSNGAFRMKEWRRGEAIVLERNPRYHGRFSGNVQRVILLPVQAWPTRLRLYEEDKLDILGVTYLAAEVREEVRQRYVDEYIARPRLETHFLAFDVTRPPFDDVRVRRAFALASDRATLADRVLQGYMAPATGGLTPPGMPGHAPAIALAFAPEQGRRLLAQAGYPGGSGFPPIDMLVNKAVAGRNQFLQGQWREILGVEVRLDVVEWPEFLARLKDVPYHLINLSWIADYPDPDNFLRVSRARAWPAWQNADYERLVQEGCGLTDAGRRLQYYRQAEEILVQEVPILPLIYERDHLLVKPWLRVYPMSAIKPAFWKDAVLA